ncbi:MAG: 16S rRNA (guanine(527)-N(7))-methyltransferase RsmG [Cyanobacteriota bacterium]
MFNEFLNQIDKYNLKLSETKIDLIKKYYKYLVDVNSKINLAGKMDEETFYLEHLSDSLSFNLINLRDHKILETYKLLDIGTGGGFPAVPLAIVYENSSFSLTESIKKKARFLSSLIEEINLCNANVFPERVEIIARQSCHREKYDIVTSRAVANINTLLEYAIPFLKMGGIFVAYKTEKELEEIKSLSRVFKIFGVSFETNYEYTLKDKHLKRELLVFKKVVKTSDDFPREPGVAAKRPIK